MIHDLHGHVGGITCVAISFDSKYVVTASRDSTCRIWIAKTSTLVKKFEYDDNVRHISLSPKEYKVVVADRFDGVKI